MHACVSACMWYVLIHACVCECHVLIHVCVCVCACMWYVSIHACVCECVYVLYILMPPFLLQVHTYVNVSMCKECMYTSVCMYACVWMYTCVIVRVYASMYVRLFVMIAYYTLCTYILSHMHMYAYIPYSPSQ
jgi:hypothetical protein